MALTLVPTSGAANANSYLTVDEATAYFESRLPLSPPFEDADSRELLLVMATRTLDALLRGTRMLVKNGKESYYVIGRAWTGLPATATQRLAWPRSGMFDQNGNAIGETIIPQELKDATAELAGQLQVADRTLDNDVAVQGITSVKAGSVAISFKDGVMAQVIPDAVINILVPSWYTEETVDNAFGGVDLAVI